MTITNDICRLEALIYSAEQTLQPIAECDWHGKWRVNKAIAFLRASGIFDTAPRNSNDAVSANNKQGNDLINGVKKSEHYPVSVKSQQGEEALLPCPFCGNAPYHHECEEMADEKGELEVICLYKDCPISTVGIPLSKWNARATKRESSEADVLLSELLGEMCLHYGDGETQPKIMQKVYQYLNGEDKEQ